MKRVRSPRVKSCHAFISLGLKAPVYPAWWGHFRLILPYCHAIFKWLAWLHELCLNFLIAPSPPGCRNCSRKKPEAKHMEKPEAKHLHLWGGRSTVGFGVGVGAVLCKWFSVRAGGIGEKSRDSEGKKARWIKACLPIAAENSSRKWQKYVWISFAVGGCKN